MHFHTPARVTPYEILYNHGPPFHLPYLLGESHNEALDGTLQRKEEIITMLKYNLENAQHRMKQQADLHRSDKIFRVGDLIWLKVQPCCQTTVQQKVNTKLSPKFYGLFQVLEVIEKVGYELKLPSNSRVHNVFHVS